MKVLLSPAKNLNETGTFPKKDLGIPVFIEQSEYLIHKLKKLSSGRIGKLMSVSAQLSDLNYERFQNWSTPFTADNARPALYTFNGEAYRGLDAASFSEKNIKSAQQRLRILSGLYGILKPMDLIQPYRLEMGTSYKVTAKKTNLYKYWDNQITDRLNAELVENEVLVNVASKEYFKVLKFDRLKSQNITCHFKEYRDGTYKAIQTFAKNARGKMAAFIIKNELETAEELKAFDLDGYHFNNELSTVSDFYFTR